MIRVVAAMKFLSIRDLTFFRENETILSQHNSNFLGVIRAIGFVWHFLALHLEKYCNKGTRKVNYISSTIVNEFVDIMAKKVIA